MKKAVIYARYSCHTQTEQSIEGQLRVCGEYAKREGLSIVGEYIDRALTGRSDDRPQFQKMISDSKKRAWDYVIVYKLDRFARNRYDSAIYKHKLKQNNIRLLSAMENIGDNPESIILEAVLEASAEYYSVDLSQKIKRGRRETASKGKFVGGGIPLGYRNQDGYLVLDETYAPHVKWAFEQYAAGISKKEILDEFNRRGLRNRNGKPFTYNSLGHAFRSEKYLGILEQSGIRVENAMPALIDRDTFERVQRRLDLMAKHGAKNKAVDVEYLLTGKVFCGHCGATMQGVSGTGRHGDKHYYYQCMSRRKHLNGCKKKHEKKDVVERYVCQKTLEFVLSPPRIEKIAAAVVEEYDKEFGDSSVSELEKRIERLNREISKAVDAALDIPKAARQQLYDRIERLGAEKEDCEIDLAKLRVANQIRYTKEEIRAWIRSFCDGDLDDPEFCKRLIDVFVNSVFLFDDKIVIYYNVKDYRQVTYTDMLDEIAGLTSPDGAAPENASAGEAGFDFLVASTTTSEEACCIPLPRFP